MQTIRNIVFLGFLYFLVTPGISFGQVRPLATGDIITRETLVPQQAGNNPVTFVSKTSVTLEVQIKENGDREFLGPENVVHIQPVFYANDKSFTDITWQDKRIPQEWRFVRFPPSGKLEPGMRWDVPTYNIKSCGNTTTVSYKATSENGPAVNIPIDGKDTRVATIRINYEAWLPTCTPGRRWKKTYEVLYSPELNELVSTKVINWYLETAFLEDGGGWAITAIQTGGKKQEPQ